MNKETKKQISFFLVLLLDILIIIFMIITSIISFFMVIKYIQEIFALTYISNINLIKWIIKTSGYIILSIISIMGADNWYENGLSKDMDTKLNIKSGIAIIIITFILILFMGWNFSIFLHWVV